MTRNAAQLRQAVYEPLSSSTIRNTFGIPLPPPKPAAAVSAPVPVATPTVVCPPIKIPEPEPESKPEPVKKAIANKKPKMGDLAFEDW